MNKATLMINTCQAMMALTLLCVAMPSQAGTQQTEVVETTDGSQLVVSHKDAMGHNEMPPPQLGISPPNLELSAHGRADASVTFYNYSDDNKTIELSLIDTDDEKNPIESSADTLKQWVLFAPQEFKMDGQGYQTIRLSFRLPANFPKKTHHAFLLISQKIENPLVSQEEDKMVFKIGARYLMPIRIDVH